MSASSSCGGGEGREEENIHERVSEGVCVCVCVCVCEREREREREREGETLYSRINTVRSVSLRVIRSPSSSATLR